jgi:hypothetical protein
MPGQSYFERYEYSNNTDAYAERHAQTHLVLYYEAETVSFSSEKLSSLFILNETEMLRFTAGQNFTAKKAWSNTTSVQETLSYQKLTDEYGVEAYLYNKTGERPARIASMYFAVRNEVNDTNYFSLRVGYKNSLVIFIGEFFGILVTFVFFYFGGKLLLDARQAQKEDQISKKHMYNNFGIAFFFGGLTTLAWELYRWYLRLEPTLIWSNPFSFERMPVEQILVISTNVLSFAAFASLGFSIMFMSNTVERAVQKKKTPLFTYILLAAGLLMVAGILYPEMLVVIIYPWVIAIVLASLNILTAYVKIARIGSRILRRQAISIVTFLITLFTSITVVRVLVAPEFIGNGLSAVFSIGLYASIKIRVPDTEISILPEPEKAKIDSLGLNFVRPTHISDEEISVSKEKKICIVCKSKVERSIYMCPLCNAFYCLRCSNALAASENSCWSCNTPFDPSKAVRTTEGEDESGESVMEVKSKNSDGKPIPVIKKKIIK